MQRVVRWTLVVVGLWAVGASECGAVERLPGDFTSAYRSALQTMKEAYSKGTIRGTARLAFPSDDRSIDQRFTLRVAGDWLRIDATVTAQKGMGAQVGKTRLILATPEVSLQGVRGAGGLLPNSSQIDSYAELDRSIHEIVPLSYPYTMGAKQGTILDMLQTGGTTIKSFKTGTLDGDRVIQIKYKQQVDPEGRQGPWECMLYVAPEEGYSLRSFSRTAGKGTRQLTVSGSLSYTINPDGIPLLERLERREERGGSIVQKQAVSVSEFDTNRPTNYWFTADGINQSRF